MQTNTPSNFTIADGAGHTFFVWAAFVLRPHLAFVNMIRRSTAFVRSNVPGSDTGDDSKLAIIDKNLMANPILREAWRSYRSSLRPDPRRAGQFLNPVDPHGWFSLDRLPGRGYEKWATTMAGVSLTVGLLFTFVGLSAALFQVGGAGSDTALLRVAIAKILEISSAKFITSMAGIVAYIAWTLVARAYTSAQAKTVSRFASAIQAMTAPITPEALLLDQLEEARAQTTRLKTLSTDMAVAFDTSLNKVIGQKLEGLPSALGEALQPALERSVRPVVEAIQGMGGSLGRSNHAALEGMMTDLMSGVRDATGREMGALVEAMREAAGELKAAKSGISDGGAEFGQTLARAAGDMSAASSKMADALQARIGEVDLRMQRIDESLSTGASRFDSMGSSMSEGLTEGLRHAMESIAAAASAGAVTAREQAQAELTPILVELKGLIGEIRNSADESRGALTEGGRSAAAQLGSAVTGVAQDLAGASATASAALVDAFDASTARMVASVEQALGGYKAATESLAARLTGVEQGFGALERSLGRQVVHLDTAGESLTSAGRTFGAASEQLNRSSAPILSSVQSVEAAATGAREALRNLQETGAAMRETASAMSAASEAAVSAFASYEQRFAGVDDGLGQTLGRLRDGVVELGNNVTEVVSKYDEHLGRAIGLLSSGVSEIAEVVDGLGDKLAKAA